MKISNIKKGIMGTINFEAKFNGMRKPQEFVVYPPGQGRPGGSHQSAVGHSNRLDRSAWWLRVDESVRRRWRLQPAPRACQGN